MQNLITHMQLCNLELENLIRYNYSLTYTEQQQIQWYLSQLQQNFIRLQEKSQLIQPRY